MSTGSNRATNNSLALPGGRDTAGSTGIGSSTKLPSGMLAVNEDAEDFEDEREEDRHNAHNAAASEKSTGCLDMLRRMLERRDNGKDDSPDGEDPDSSLDKFGNVKGQHSIVPDEGDLELKPLQPLNLGGRKQSVMTLGSGGDHLSSPGRISTMSGASGRMSTMSGSTSRRGSSMIDGKLEIEIVDMRFFDFSLPKNKANIEITYIEVNYAMTFSGYSKLQEEETRKEEKIVITPDQVKEIHIALDGFTELPINPLGFISNSGSFPMSQKWTRPKRLRYPLEAEVTLELMVKNSRCFTQPHMVTLQGTSSFLNYCLTS
jgi:hypothetical protein